MKRLYITGSSKGIGRAISESALNTGWEVFGYAREDGPSHPHYSHQHADLLEPDKADSIKFAETGEPSAVVLINNAAMLGPVTHLHQIRGDVIDEVVRLNLTVPAILSANFIRAFADRDIPRLIVNIGTGASSSPYDGWSLYCATKAGMDMLTRVLDIELAMLPAQEHGFNVRTIAPGVVATAMQETLREAGEDGFSRRGKFVELHESGSLSDPAAVGRTYVELAEKIIADPDSWPELITRIPQIPG